MQEPFKFHECVFLLKMTGQTAADCVELLDRIKAVSAESIFHHMHQYFLKPYPVEPEYTNDFATWVASELGEKSLAEALANLNPFEFDSIEDVRAELARILTDYMLSFPLRKTALKGKEFFFNEGITIVLPAGFEARGLGEFIEAMEKVDCSSIYFHFYEARLRLGKRHDDFSRFFEQSLCRPSLAKKLGSLDPYMYSTEALRAKIIEIARKDFESGH